MSVIVKKQKKKDRGVNFKITNRDVDDPLYHDPDVSNRVLVYAPTASEVNNRKKRLTKDKMELINTVLEDTNTYDEIPEIDEEKDQVDYAIEQFQKEVEEGEGEDDYEYESEGDEEDYELTQIDREFAEDVKENYKYKPAEGVKMVEYDAYGLPKTAEMAKMKRELNLKDEDVLKDDDSHVLFIKPPEDYFYGGHHKNVDIDRKVMNKDMREVYDMMEENDEQIPEEDCIEDDLINQLNEGLPALVEKTSDDDMEEYKGYEEFVDFGEGDDEKMRKAREEADALLQNMPPGLDEEMQMRLAGAREHLAQKKAAGGAKLAKEAPETREELENGFEDILQEYQDDDIGAVADDMMEPMSDMIDQDAFDEIMQEFIENNKEVCKKLYSKYHDDEFRSRITVEGENVEEIVDTDDGDKEKIYKFLKQSNGEIVKLVPKEEMAKVNEKLNAKQIEAARLKIKERILKYHEEQIKKEEEAGLDEIEEDDEEGEGEGDQEKWDVESILSTRTNTDNHPGIIKGVVKPKKNRIKLDPKTKIPDIGIDIEDGNTGKKHVPNEGPYKQEVVSENDSDEEIEVDTQELKDLESMSEKERKKYLRKMNKKQVKKEKKDRRQEKKEMKKEFAKQNQKYAKMHTAGKGELRPGLSVRKI